ncbi:MAG: hypothetical protein ABSH25_18010 [Syntrophorhabdales bacterium]
MKQGHKVPESVVVAGNPARKIRDMSQNDIDFWNKARRIYVDLAAKYLSLGMGRVDRV